jgi:hypothetical protein
MFVSLCVRRLDRYTSDAFGHIEREFYICLTICIRNGSVQDQIRMSLLGGTGIGAQDDKEGESYGKSGGSTD